MRQSNAGERCDTECNKIITIAQIATVWAIGSSVGAGLPAMQTPRYATRAGMMLSQHGYLHIFWYGAVPVARELAPAGGLRADEGAGSDRVHIRYLGNGCYWFRSYSGSLLKSRNAGPDKGKQNALAPTLGTSLRLGVPVIRHGFGGPPPRAIHGAGRLNRHPCRFTPQIHVGFRPAWFNGAPEIKSRSRSRATRFASWLPSVAIKLCRYLWLSQASQLPHF